MYSFLITRRSLLGHFILLVFFAGILLSIGGPIGFLDARFAYPVSEVTATLERLGTDGRARYALNEKLDLLFMLIYASFLWRVQKALRHSPAARALRLARATTLLVVLADLIETGGILLLLDRFPEEPAHLAAVISASTPFKWTAAAVTLIALYRANQTQSMSPSRKP